MTRPQLKASVDNSWLHNPTVGKYFPFVPGIEAIFRRWIQSSEDCFLSGRPLRRRVTRLANFGAIANLGPSYEYEVESDLPNTIPWASCEEVI